MPSAKNIGMLYSSMPANYPQLNNYCCYPLGNTPALHLTPTRGMSNGVRLTFYYVLSIVHADQVVLVD